MSVELLFIPVSEVHVNDLIEMRLGENVEKFRVTEIEEKPKQVWVTLVPISPHLFGSLQRRLSKRYEIEVERSS